MTHDVGLAIVAILVVALLWLGLVIAQDRLFGRPVKPAPIWFGDKCGAGMGAVGISASCEKFPNHAESGDEWHEEHSEHLDARWKIDGTSTHAEYISQH